jgi:hypothetical protein
MGKKSGNLYGGGDEKKKKESKEQRAQRRAVEKEKRELHNRSFFRPYLEKIEIIERRIKYLFGMNELFKKDISGIIPPLTHESKIALCYLKLKTNFLLTSEYHWIDSGVIQRPFDKITESIQIEGGDHVSVTSLQGIDALLRQPRSKKFVAEMEDSREMVAFSGWREKFRVDLEKELFGYDEYYSNTVAIIKKIWGEHFENFRIDWPLDGGYRRSSLHVKVGKENVDGWFKEYRYSAHHQYSSFRGSQKVFFGCREDLNLHEAGENYASHESILPKMKVS